MPSLAEGHATALAAQWMDGPVTLTLLRGGRNNRLYRVDGSDGRRAALKLYPPAESDDRDRLGAEWRALSLTAAHGEEAVPRPLACAPQERAALYEWIEGEPAPAADADAMDQAAALLSRLHRLRRDPAAAGLSEASEACLSGAELLRQLRGRFDRLLQVEDEPGLQDLLQNRFRPALQLAEAALAGETQALGRESATLSPSDFGLHNAIRRPDGRLAFLDFEYFGWDDPVKLVSDTLWHPGMALSADLAKRLRDRALEIYGAEDPAFAARLARHHPFYGLRWVAIILNEFLPERWLLRLHSGAGEAEARAAREGQLGKARRWLDRIGPALEDGGH